MPKVKFCHFCFYEVATFFSRLLFCLSSQDTLKRSLPFKSRQQSSPRLQILHKSPLTICTFHLFSLFMPIFLHARITTQECPKP